MCRILIVSDDVPLRSMIRYALSGLDAEVRCADCRAMQQIAQRVLFDLVIVLGTVPFWGGCDVVRMLRPEGLRRPLIYVIAWQQSEQTVLSLLECGVDQYLTFPVSLQRLRAKIDHEISRRL